jgi:hypothetical protein
MTRRTSLYIIMMTALALVFVVSGCSTPAGHQLAFSDKTALIKNNIQLELSASQALRVVKQALIHQGFTIDSVDVNAGLVKATRNFQDPEMPEQSYNVTTSIFFYETGPETTNLTVAASQQTILHRQWKTWWHLFWLIPIFPTGTEYQTVVTNEGNITDQPFYADFFKVISAAGVEVREAEKAATRKAAAEKAAAEKAAEEKAAAEKAAAEQAAAEKAIAQASTAESTGALTK